MPNKKRKSKFNTYTSENYDYEADKYVEKQIVRYKCKDGKEFDIVFAQGADIPDTWMDTKSGKFGSRIQKDNVEPEEYTNEEKDVKVAKNPWDMLLERRSREELDSILDERLTYIRKRRGLLKDTE